MHRSAQRAQPLELGALRAVLLAELEPEITRALQVAVLLAAGHQHTEITRQLGCSSWDFTALQISSPSRSPGATGPAQRSVPVAAEQSERP